MRPAAQIRRMLKVVIRDIWLLAVLGLALLPPRATTQWALWLTPLMLLLSFAVSRGLPSPLRRTHDAVVGGTLGLGPLAFAWLLSHGGDQRGVGAFLLVLAVGAVYARLALLVLVGLGIWRLYRRYSGRVPGTGLDSDK